MQEMNNNEPTNQLQYDVDDDDSTQHWQTATKYTTNEVNYGKKKRLLTPVRTTATRYTTYYFSVLGVRTPTTEWVRAIRSIAACCLHCRRLHLWLLLLLHFVYRRWLYAHFFASSLRGHWLLQTEQNTNRERERGKESRRNRRIFSLVVSLCLRFVHDLCCVSFFFFISFYHSQFFVATIKIESAQWQRKKQ